MFAVLPARAHHDGGQHKRRGVLLDWVSNVYEGQALLAPDRVQAERQVAARRRCVINVEGAGKPVRGFDYSAALRSGGGEARNCSSKAASSALAALRCRALT